MKFLWLTLQFLLVYGFYLAGEWLVNLFNIPFPGSIIGFLLLFAALCLKLVPLRAIEAGAQGILAFLPLFFVPATVGIMSYFDLFAGSGVWLIVIIVVSTFLTIIVSGLVSQSVAGTVDKRRQAK
ncbi:CidA/LrgA family protein [Planomicrobium sp. YIM 101495]|uniref:CidA/LrgA family protein n=1 Tax=Planomicrobium sp. YIM 101495 TaxID=2665160 RepID=UPI0013F7649B|nr:CidA/LrgA family holin-like protein [Planomicrobium sp. YIM 101495]